RPRESEHWSRVQGQVARAFGREPMANGTWAVPTEDTPHVVAVFDREGDIYEAMRDLLEMDHGFVIRAIRSRKLREKVHGETLSFAAVEAAPELGRTPFEVPRRPGQAARATCLSVRSAPLTILPPRNLNRRGNAVSVS